MRSRPETTLLSSRTKTTGNGQERPPVTTQITTRMLPDDPDLAVVIEAWGRLPDTIKAGILAMVKVAVK